MTIYCSRTPGRLPIDVCNCEFCVERRNLAAIVARYDKKPSNPTPDLSEQIVNALFDTLFNSTWASRYSAAMKELHEYKSDMIETVALAAEEHIGDIQTGARKQYLRNLDAAIHEVEDITDKLRSREMEASEATIARKRRDVIAMMLLQKMPG